MGYRCQLKALGWDEPAPASSQGKSNVTEPGDSPAPEVKPGSDSKRNSTKVRRHVPSYGSSLSRLAKDHQRLALALAAAEIRRASLISRLASDTRIKGIDELLTKLDEISTAFERDSRLAKLSFLIVRVTADFETALEATISSYLSVAFDAMRDVLEVQYLLFDFGRDKQLIDEWLQADDRTLRDKFGPVHVRRRLKDGGIGDFGENAQSADYKGHSRMLHLRPPNWSVLPSKGRARPDLFSDDMGFWEIFEHAHGVWRALDFLVSKIAPDSEANRILAAEPRGISSAWQQTNRSQTLFTGIIEAGLNRQSGDKTAAATILTRALIRAGALAPQVIKSGDLEQFDAAVRELTASTDPAVRMAAMGLEKLLNEPSDPEEGQTAGYDPS